MKSHLVLAGAAAGFVLAAAIMLFLRREDVPSQREDEGFRTRTSQLEHRLDELESRMSDASARSEDSSARLSSEGRGSPQATEAAAPDLLREIARLRSDINGLSYRIQALEQDPINRGYTFVNSQSPQLRREGISALKRFAAFDPAARQAIRNMLSDPNEQVRREAADALGDLGDKESAPLMAQLMNDADPGVRREAIDSFADWGHKESAPLIARMLSDANADVRHDAIEALGRLGAAESGASIAQLLSDSSERVREEAANVLGQVKARESTAALVAALNDSNEEVRGEAIASLGEVGAVEAIPYLRAIYEGNPERHLIRLVRAMRALGDAEPFQREVQRLSQVALSGENAEARGRAVQTLSSFARLEARDVFMKALEDQSDWVRREAERALGRR